MPGRPRRNGPGWRGYSYSGCSRCFESIASGMAMSSLCTRIPRGTRRCVGAKFQMPRTPPAINASQADCAALAGTVRTPISMRWFRHHWLMFATSRMGLPAMREPMSVREWSKAARISTP